MKIFKLLEARRNNTAKMNINDAIADYQKKFPETGYASFTRILKLGVNPGSIYATPNGIYAYPISYVVKRLHTTTDAEGKEVNLPKGERKNTGSMPFAGDGAFVNFFTVPNESVLEVSQFTTANLLHYVNILKTQYPTEIANIFERSKTESSKLEDGEIHPINQFWFITRELSGRNANKWQAILTSLGIMGVTDKTGLGLIHPSEKTQAVFFSTGIIKNHVTVDNKYSDTHQAGANYYKEQVPKWQKNAAVLYNKLKATPIALLQAVHSENSGTSISFLPKEFILNLTIQEIMQGLNHTDELSAIKEITNLRKNNRFIKLEPEIIKFPEFAILYAQRLNARWPELENELLRLGRGKLILAYLKTNVKARWEQAEPILKNSSNLMTSWGAYKKYLKEIGIELPPVPKK